MNNLYFITVLDILYTNFIYIVLSIITGVLVDRFYGPFDESRYRNKNISVITLDIIFHIILLSLVLFICRHVVLQMLSPFAKVKGYDRSSLYQLNNATIFTAMLFIFQNNLTKKIAYFHSEIDKIRV